MSTSSPTFRMLSRQESEEILARNAVGRLAYARENRIDIEPVNYVYDDGWIYGRTSPGRKLEMTGRTWWPVAFEVDEVEDLFDWRSAVVHGGMYVIDPDASDGSAEIWERGIGLLRKLIPETMTDEDPVAFRDIVFRIAVQEISGREAIPGGPGVA